MRAGPGLLLALLVSPAVAGCIRPSTDTDPEAIALIPPGAIEVPTYTIQDQWVYRSKVRGHDHLIVRVIGDTAEVGGVPVYTLAQGRFVWNETKSDLNRIDERGEERLFEFPLAPSNATRLTVPRGTMPAVPVAKRGADGGVEVEAWYAPSVKRAAKLVRYDAGAPVEDWELVAYDAERSSEPRIESFGREDRWTQVAGGRVEFAFEVGPEAQDLHLGFRYARPTGREALTLLLFDPRGNQIPTPETAPGEVALDLFSFPGAGTYRLQIGATGPTPPTTYSYQVDVYY
ncbi:MAG: hypothetical protein ACT4PT_09420 [Methanobacteriota archaeon]